METQRDAPKATIQVGKYRKEPLVELHADSCDITFFIPCFNEEPNVVGAITKLISVSSELELNFEILVFDDGSSDRTVEVVEKFISDNPEVPLQLFANEANRGVAANFFEGAFCGKGRHYRLVCGDNIEPVETHKALLERIGDADIVVPYFTHIEGRPLHRHIISRSFTALANLTSGQKLHYYNGCPIYRRWDVLRFHIETTGMGYQAEFLTRLLNERRSYVEVSVESMDREGSSSLTMRNFVSVGHSLLKMSLRRLHVYFLK